MQPHELPHSSNASSSRPPSTLSRHLPIFLLLFISLQLLRVRGMSQWGISRTRQASFRETLDYLRETETQVQITISFLYLCGRRWYSGPLSVVAKSPRLAQASERFARLASLLPFYGPHTSVFAPKVLDSVLISTLVSRFCVPQSTSVFTSPCRPFTSPLPQCQDLLHSPPTYVMTFWVVSLLLSTTPEVLTWFENGMPVLSHFSRRHRLSSSIFRDSLLTSLVRICLLLYCLNLAFGEVDLEAPPWVLRPALFSPVTPTVYWAFSISVSAMLAMLAMALRWVTCNVLFPSCFRLFLHFSRVSIHPSN